MGAKQIGKCETEAKKWFVYLKEYANTQTDFF